MNGDASFGKWLKERRRAQDLSREELAQRVGCAVETIRKLETDARRPSRQIAELLADQLLVPQSERSAFLQAARAPRKQDRLPGAAAEGGTGTRQPLLSNLPIPPTPLIGRAHEVAAVCTVLTGDTVRLLTLTGPPGIGKTRLGLQVATEMLPAFAGGVYFVALAPLTGASQIAGAIAQALGVKEVAGERLVERIKHHLRSKQVLLLLDNFEQILEGAPLVAQLLGTCPQLKVLATSRAPLHLSGEHEYAVPPLAVPDLRQAPGASLHDLFAEYEAIRLFVARARAVRSDFDITSADALAIAEICVQLDGLPLAIELAAARIKYFSPRALRARLVDAGRGSLDLLAARTRDLPERQQTLRGAIDWSYKLLDPEDQRLFTRLGVFAAACTLEAAEHVCDAAGDLGKPVWEGIASLVDQSLLQRVEAPERILGEHPRFAMLELIREYAREQLEMHGELEELRRQHAGYYLRLVERAEPELAKPRQAAWLLRLLAEYNEIREALRWLEAQEEWDLAGRMAAALWQFWEVRGMLSEGREWLEGLLHGPVLSPAVRAEVANAAGQLARHQGDLGRAFDLFQENLALRRELEDWRGIAYGLSDLGSVTLARGDLAGGTALLEESLGRFRERQDSGGIADVLLMLSGALLFQGYREEARSQLDEAHTRFRDAGNLRGLSASACGLAFLSLIQGEEARAASLFEESLKLNRQIGDKLFTVYDLEGLAALAARQGRPLRAARLMGAVAQLRETLGVPELPAFYFDLEASLAPARAEVGSARWQAAWTHGRALSLEEIVAYALEPNDG